MDMHVSPLMIISALVMGSISAYLAHKNKKNPYKWFSIGFLFGIFGIFAIFFASARKKTARRASSKPILNIQGPTDKFWYYIDPSKQQQGPMSKDALTLAWKEGKVGLSTYVWHEEMTEWTPLKKTMGAKT